MKKFEAIEGLRAWLAWAMVLDHLAYWSDTWGVLGNILRNTGIPAVMVFITISGFVITHLVSEGREPYRIYITRRFFRLFPLFAVACVAGYFAYRLQMQLDVPFDPVFTDWIRRIVASQDQYLWQHIVAHATMLYGAIPYAWLPEADYVFLMPAWSISLEWQFYLIAPLIVWALIKRPMLAPALALAFLAIQLLLRKVLTGSYEQPAFMLTVSGYFAIGIASRLLYPTFKGRIKQWHVPLACIIAAYSVTRQHSLAAWAVAYLGLLAPPSRLYQLALQSPVALYLGSRSYSTYLGHFLVIVACQHIGVRWLGHVPSFLVLALMVIPATLLLSEVLYRTVELPGIRLGSKLRKRLQPKPQALLRVA